MNLRRSPAYWIANGLGSGLAPRAPGTFGSLAALLVWWMCLRHLPLAANLAIILATFALGTWAAQRVIDQMKQEDPGLIVIDEWIGLWIALLWAPDHWLAWLLGFALFRLFDIAKPWPVSWADRRLHGGFGTMLDDAFAGLYALACLQGLIWLWSYLTA